MDIDLLLGFLMQILDEFTSPCFQVGVQPLSNGGVSEAIGALEAYTVFGKEKIDDGGRGKNYQN